MNINKSLICPKCNDIHFEIKREATYLYTYKLETPLNNKSVGEKEALPFLFDNRNLLNSNEYIQCKGCNSIYPCTLDNKENKLHLTILQKAIPSDIVNEPEFLG